MWILIELAKYLLLGYGILGFSYREGKRKWIVVLLGGVFLYLVDISDFAFFVENRIVFKTGYFLCVIFLFFEERFVKKMQAAVLEYLLINILDGWIWGILAVAAGGSFQKEQHIIVWSSELAGFLIWCVICRGVWKWREEIHREFVGLTVGYFGLLIFVTTGLAGVMGLAQIAVLDGENASLGSGFFLLCASVCLIYIVVVSAFVFNLSKT